MNTARFALSLSFVLTTAGLGCTSESEEPEPTASQEAALAKGDYGYELLTDAVTAETMAQPAALRPAQVDGRLAPELVRDVVRMQLGAYEACERAATARGGQPAGEIVVRFVIAADGTVAGTRKERSQVADEAMVTCVRDAIAALRFPRSQAGRIEVVYPLQFGAAR